MTADGPVQAVPDPEIEPQLFPGTGRFFGEPSSVDRPLLTDGEGGITLNFVETDVHEVVRTILGETLGLNYTVDPNVTGTVTLRTRSPVPRDALLSTLETLLADNGLGLAVEDGLYRVLLITEGGPVRTAPGIATAPSSIETGYGTDIFPLKYAAAAEVLKVVQPLVGLDAQLSIDEARNLLIVTGPSRQRRAVYDAVEMFDVDWMEGMSFALFPIRSAEPATIIEELETIFGVGQDNSRYSRVRFVPIERLGVVLTIARDPNDLREVRAWVERLDQGLVENGRRLYVYYAQHVRVDEVITVLQDIFQTAESGNSGGMQSQAGDLADGLDPVRIASPEMAQDGARTLDDGMRNGRGDSGSAEQRRSGSASSAATTAGIRITADEINNALFTLATPRDYRLVEAAIRNLDIVPLQVLIEATIAEVTLTDELRYGVQWFFREGDSSAALTSSETGLPIQEFPGFSYLYATANARVVLNALDSVTDVNVISSPQLMVLDNRTATLQVGDEVPVVTQSAVGVTDPDAPIVNQIEFRDTGVILTVLPRVNSGGTVTMEIQQEVSDVVPTTTSGIDSPTIRQRRIESTVSIRSGQTIALGGLIRDSVSSVESGLPIAKDIPLLGNLFKSTTNDKERTELLVLITPRVIRNDSEALQITDQLRQRLRAVQPLGDRID
ncbi:type II secretion system secretin GspD [Virgifigura deserti]|uniref:type II secretion system secretin GspD n=1 Tax=Virgifigura deserti TaxID=2268457 RepID=UPI003CCBA871